MPVITFGVANQIRPGDFDTVHHAAKHMAKELRSVIDTSKMSIVEREYFCYGLFATDHGRAFIGGVCLTWMKSGDEIFYTVYPIGEAMEPERFPAPTKLSK